MPKRKRTNNDLQRSSNTNSTKTRGEHRCSTRISRSCSTSGTRCITEIKMLNISTQNCPLVGRKRISYISCSCS